MPRQDYAVQDATSERLRRRAYDLENILLVLVSLAGWLGLCWLAVRQLNP